ncbi:MAG: STAS/SEC14 domain-containing protein [Pseudomonadota bacterium]
MLTVEIDKSKGIAILSPDGALTSGDFENVSNTIDLYIEESGQLNGIVIHSKSFPGWDSFAALCSHLKFVKEHHKSLSNIAVVTDSRIGNFAESIAGHFINSTVKLFPYSHLDEAKEWASNTSSCDSENLSGIFNVTVCGENRLDIELTGKLSAEDMKVALDELLGKSENVKQGRMLYTITNFDFPSFGAIGVELSRLPELIRMIKKYDRCAVLANENWIKNISELEGFLFPGLEIKAFNLNEKEIAEAWLAVN